MLSVITGQCILLSLIHISKTAPDKSEFVELAFEKGVTVSLNGAKMKPAVLIAKLNEIGGRNGIGLYLSLIHI